MNAIISLLSIFVFAGPTTAAVVAPNDDLVIDAGHHVTLAGELIVVRSEWLGAPTHDAVALAVALPPEVVVDGIEAQRADDGSVVALGPSGGEVTFSISLPLSQVRELGAVPTAFTAHGTHRITFDDALTFDPSIALGLSPRRTWSVSGSVVSHPERWLDPRLESVPGAQGMVRYATSRDLMAAGGWRGQLQTTKARRQTLLVWIGAAFVVVVTALAAVYRRMQRGAEFERAEALLDAEFAALDGPPSS